MEPTASKNDSRPIFLYPVLNQADFDNPFINGHLDIITWTFEDEFHFLRICKSSRQRINKGSQKDASLYVAGSHVSKSLNLNVSGIKRDVAPKQRYDRSPSSEVHTNATSTFQHARAIPRHTIIGGSQKSKEEY